ncbi:uncharacterized protein N7477_009838 [Penicillium maclennaniae]|uniref:uncharacterized protein n=1 Tax=Penicillium maclennaniae TaxID=1343394 RepID=UPI00254048B8|nr:uncharacterized protein N7477_009838 [Penicillium maclennaniae]KAJ5662222.1 hypothetical protein N7477_009838 [Penicillium maclennaniae]
MDEADGRPDPYIRAHHAEHLEKARVAVAGILNAPKDECVFVKNATTGVATVLYNLNFQSGEAIIFFESVYGAVEKSIVSLQEHSNLESRKVPFQFPISEDELESRFREVVRKTREEGLKVVAAVFDTIVSNPGCRFPFERFTAICREEDILSVIDGAHGIGQIPLDLEKLQPDFLVSNCHKYDVPGLPYSWLWPEKTFKTDFPYRWLYTPRSCAVLYVPKRNQHFMRTTLPTSWGFIPGPSSTDTRQSVLADPNTVKKSTLFEGLFEFVATSDDSAYICIPAALQFRKEVCGGEEAVMSYCTDLAIEAADIVAYILGTEVLQEPDLKPGETSNMRQCAMATVRLPIAVSDEPVSGAAVTISPNEAPGVFSWIQTTLMKEHDTFVPVFRHGSWLWTRLSAQTYLDKSDFEWLGGILRDLCEQVAKKEGKWTATLAVH